MLVNIASWNVNSINARCEIISQWLEKNPTEILLLQETKCQDINFPRSNFSQYNILHIGQKSYNGVAILSKHPIQEVSRVFHGMPEAGEARFLHASFNFGATTFDIINVYVPNGGEIGSQNYVKKIIFLDNLSSYLNNLNPNHYIIIGGDFNVAPFDIDVYSPEIVKEHLLFTMIEKRALRKILNSGFVDLYRLQNPNANDFSWWDYRQQGFERNAGLRIDFLLSNHKLADFLKESAIDLQPRKQKGCSDHTPVIVKFDLGI